MICCLQTSALCSIEVTHVILNDPNEKYKESEYWYCAYHYDLWIKDSKEFNILSKDEYLAHVILES